MPKQSPASEILSVAEKETIRNIDRMLPSQPVMKKLFDGNDDAFHSRLELLTMSVLPKPDIEQKWKLELKPGVSYASLGSDTGTLYFYQLLIQLGGIRHVLELGTYIGVSTLFLAEAVGPEGSVTTVERGEEFFSIAKRNFSRNGLESRIHQILGNATELLSQHANEGRAYNMVLLDAAKEEYALMLAPALQCLTPGGLLVVDDIFMNGDTLNPEPHTEKGNGIHQLLEKVSAIGSEYSRVILPIGNGIMMIRKPG